MPMMEMPLPPMQLAQVVVERPVAGNGKRGLPPNSASAYAETFKMRCHDVERIIPGQEVLADQPGLYDSSRQIAIVHVVLNRLGYKDVGGRYVNLPDQVFKAIKTGVEESPKHGRITVRAENGYDYKPTSGYLGRDRIVFWVEVAGKRYRVIQDLAVVEGIADNTPPGCVTGKFKVSGIDWDLVPLTTSIALSNAPRT